MFRLNKVLFPDSDVNGYLAKLNIKRAWMLCIGEMLFMLCAYFDDMLNDSINFTIAFLGLNLVAISYLIFYIFIYNRISSEKLTIKFLQYIYRTYWIMTIIWCIPLFIYNAQNHLVPIHYILVSGGLMVIPVFTKIESIITFSFLTLINILIGIMSKSPVSFFFYTIITTFVVYLFSTKTHQYYIDIITQLITLAKTDQLTNLPNRVSGLEKFQAVLSLANRYNQTCAFFMIDIDYFKLFNDKYGHSIGDEVLKIVALALDSCFGRSSDALCRYGGEEFAAAILIKEEKDALKLGLKLQTAVREYSKNYEFTKIDPLTISVGISIYTPEDKMKSLINTQIMLDIADEALYIAKNAGRDRVIYTICTIDKISYCHIANKET